MRTDDNNNPVAFTTDIAAQAGLEQGVDYVAGDPFQSGALTLYTAKLLGDPVATTIRVIDTLGFYTQVGYQRWVYVGIPKWIWDSLTGDQKRDVIGGMYRREGGTALIPLFPNYKTAAF